MPSNLPPGCSSPDGGLDHAMEAALENLCQSVETPNCAAWLAILAPLVEKLLSGAYAAGLADGRWEADAEARNRIDLRGE